MYSRAYKKVPVPFALNAVCVCVLVLLCLRFCSVVFALKKRLRTIFWGFHSRSKKSLRSVFVAFHCHFKKGLRSVYFASHCLLKKRLQSVSFALRCVCAHLGYLGPNCENQWAQVESEGRGVRADVQW